MEITLIFPKSIAIEDNLLPEEAFLKIKNLGRHAVKDFKSYRNGEFNVDSTKLTNDKLHQYVQLQPFAQTVLEKAQDYAKQIGYSEPITNKMQIDNLWVNVSEGGDFVFPHMHPGSFISGAFYAAAPEDSKITFFENLNVFSPQADMPTHLNKQKVMVDCKPNRLVLFRSDLIHGVFKQSPGERIVFSFNTSLKD